MLSNKLTFSLASLIVLLMVGLCLPASAQMMRVLPAGSIAKDALNVYSHAASDSITTASPDAAALSGVTPARLHDGNTDDTDGHGFPYNLADFFALGGTIELIVAKNSPFAKDKLVISEIMWGIDRGAAANAMRNLQWIELENKSGAVRNIALPTINLNEAALNTINDPNAVYVLFTRYNRETGDTANYIKAKASAADTANSGVFTTTAHALGAVKDGARVKSDGGYTHMVIDRVSNVNLNAFGGVTGVFQMPGQSGNTGATSDINQRETLISAQRIDVGKGAESGGWAATVPQARRNTNIDLIQANPGVSGTAAGIAVTPAAKTVPPANRLVINEVRNHTNDDLDWIEVKNIQSHTGGKDVELDGWQLSYAIEEKKEVVLAKFPKYKLPPQDILLVVNRDPSETELAGGVDLDVMVNTDEEQLKKGSKVMYIVRGDLKLPDADFLLLLRSATDKNNTHEAIEDVAGRHEIDGYTADRTKQTKVWPLFSHGSLGDDRVKEGFGRAGDNTKAWARKTDGGRKAPADERYDYGIAKTDGRRDDAWADVTSADTGGLGYDRGARKAVDLRFTPGTPGYENATANTVDDHVGPPDHHPDLMEIDKDHISISEVMYDAGPRWNLVQWIELYNQSMTQAVDIAGWEMEIRNAADDVQSYVDSVFTFVDDGNTVIPPNQTLLIVSASGNSENIAPNRVYNLFEHHRRQLGLETRRSVLLSPTGFYLKLTDRADLDRDSRKDKDIIVDEAGNVEVEGAKRTVRWALPEAPSADGFRRSLVRQYGARYTPRGGNDPNNIRYQPEGGELANVGNPTAADLGSATNGWMDFWRASDLAGAGISFYGHEDDYSTPGYRTGGPLPVSLSSFRPVRDKATGEVVVRWVTQSELNNAGFNILRSETKAGQFKVVNVKGIIPGHGTTSEKHVYEWKDTTAKPNVVYYYQIEDVSLDGNRTLLTTTRLKGHVSAAGKLTTTWSDLKQRD